MIGTKLRKRLRAFTRITIVFIRDVKAKVTSTIAELMLVGILGSALIPVAVNQYINTNTTGWDSATKTLWQQLPTLTVVGLFMVVLGVAIYKLKSR